MPQQIKLGSTVHRRFHKLQPLGLRFDRSLTLRQFQGCGYCRIITAQTTNKDAQFGEGTGIRFGQPWIERISALDWLNSAGKNWDIGQRTATVVMAPEGQQLRLVLEQGGGIIGSEVGGWLGV